MLERCPFVSRIRELKESRVQRIKARETLITDFGLDLPDSRTSIGSSVRYILTGSWGRPKRRETQHTPTDSLELTPEAQRAAHELRTALGVIDDIAATTGSPPVRVFRDLNNDELGPTSEVVGQIIRRDPNSD